MSQTINRLILALVISGIRVGKGRRLRSLATFSQAKASESTLVSRHASSLLGKQLPSASIKMEVLVGGEMWMSSGQDVCQNYETLVERDRSGYDL